MVLLAHTVGFGKAHNTSLQPPTPPASRRRTCRSPPPLRRCSRPAQSMAASASSWSCCPLLSGRRSGAEDSGVGKFSAAGTGGGEGKPGVGGMGWHVIMPHAAPGGTYISTCTLPPAQAQQHRHAHFPPPPHWLACQKGGGNLAVLEGGYVQHGAQQRRVVLHTPDDVAVQGAAHGGQGGGAVHATSDQLGDLGRGGGGGGVRMAAGLRGSWVQLVVVGGPQQGGMANCRCDQMCQTLALHTRGPPNSGPCGAPVGRSAWRSRCPPAHRCRSARWAPTAPHTAAAGRWRAGSLVGGWGGWVGSWLGCK